MSAVSFRSCSFRDKHSEILSVQCFGALPLRHLCLHPLLEDFLRLVSAKSLTVFPLAAQNLAMKTYRLYAVLMTLLLATGCQTVDQAHPDELTRASQEWDRHFNAGELLRWRRSTRRTRSRFRPASPRCWDERRCKLISRVSLPLELTLVTIGT